MAKHGRIIGLAFLVIITALASAVLLPALFDNLIQQQNSDNQIIMESMRMLIMIFVTFVIIGAMSIFTGENNV